MSSRQVDVIPTQAGLACKVGRVGFQAGKCWLSELTQSEKVALRQAKVAARQAIVALKSTISAFWQVE